MLAVGQATFPLRGRYTLVVLQTKHHQALRVPAGSAAEHLFPRNTKEHPKVVFCIAAGPGFEPRYQPPEGRGLPLADPAMLLVLPFNVPYRNCVRNYLLVNCKFLHHTQYQVFFNPTQALLNESHKNGAEYPKKEPADNATVET